MIQGTYEVVPVEGATVATVEVPGSKSITNRALVLAALYSRRTVCRLHRILNSEDTRVMREGLIHLGFDLSGDTGSGELAINPPEGDELIPASEADLFIGNSGTTVRFLTAMVSLGNGRYRLDGVARMRERPIEDLLDALRQLGVNAYSEYETGCPPVIVDSTGLLGGALRVRGDISSQYLSGLLMAAPAAQSDVVIEVDGPLVSRPYVDMTVEMLKQWGLAVDCDSTLAQFRIPGMQQGSCDDYTIEADASAASYFLGAAAVTGGEVTVLNLPRKSLQGDSRFADVLAKMGCDVQRQANSVTVKGNALHGIDVDMNDISDTVMTLGAVACFADGPTTIRNVGHIRHKETDRLAALAAELRRVGAEVDEWEDGLRITPAPLHGAEIETYDDHRMAMSLALVGLRIPGIVIKDPGCVGKTYPHFFDDLEKLR